jgi:PKD repeat protein
MQYSWWGGITQTFHFDAGTTYYFQASMTGYEWGGWVINFSLNFAPPINVDFGYWPSDPNIFDTVQFNNYSNDPGGASFTTTSWNFGDGTTSQDWNPTHRFTHDGNYTVQLNETTIDGRTGSISKQVQVRTHDVMITKFVVPQSAKAGQTRSITVDINNQRYPETVEVQLYKSTQTGFVLVGTLTQYVPVRSSNRTTTFAFSYTFTNEDAVIGNVTFRAVANLVGARDALPANNEAIALPTKVAR